MLKKFAVAVLALLVLTVPTFACNATTGCYGALAGGTWKDSDGYAQAAAAAAWNYPSQSSANNAAMQKCNNDGYNCEVMGTFSNGGCGFIAIGTNYDSVYIRTDSTKGAVRSFLSNAGYDVGQIYGGCTAR